MTVGTAMCVAWPDCFHQSSLLCSHFDSLLTGWPKTSRNLRKNIRKSSPNHQILQNFNFCAGNLEKIEKPREIFKKFSKNHRQISKFYKILIFVQEIFRKLQKPRVFFKKLSKNIKFYKISIFVQEISKKLKKPREIFKKFSKNYQKIITQSPYQRNTRGIARTTKIHELDFFLIFFKNPKNWKNLEFFFKKKSKIFQKIIKKLSKNYRKIFKKLSKNYQKIFEKFSKNYHQNHQPPTLSPPGFSQFSSNFPKIWNVLVCAHPSPFDFHKFPHVSMPMLPIYIHT